MRLIEGQSLDATHNYVREGGGREKERERERDRVKKRKREKESGRE